MDVRLDGRTAIITGGSKGLGLAMAKEFAASGADVAILARDPASLAEAKTIASTGARGRVATFSCDVSKAEDIQKTYDAVIAELGKVDILINNAGTSRAMTLDKITDDIWQEDLDLKLFAAIRLSRLVWEGMKARKWGRIPPSVGHVLDSVRRHKTLGANEPYEAFRAKMGANIPIGRVGKAEEFAAMACFLCSDHAGFTTGTAINMDGGASPVV